MNLSFSVFKEQLPIIGDGRKMQTIRVYKEHRHWNPGDRVDGYWRLRYPKKKGGSQELFHGLCVGHALINFYEDITTTNDHSFTRLAYELKDIREIPLVAGKLDWSKDGVMREDGFSTLGEMYSWFKDTHGEEMWTETFQVIKFDYIWPPRTKWSGNELTPRPFGPDHVERLRKNIPEWWSSKWDGN